jgi:hypothetical protein
MAQSDQSAMVEIQAVLGRFMNSFDLKDWDRMRRALCATLHLDYSDLRGDAPRDVAADDYVATRKQALGPLKTHHLLSNVDVTTNGAQASAEATCMIFRRAGGEHFNSHAHYRFGLQLEPEGWRIASIAQRILWNEGNPDLHSGVPRESGTTG